MRTEVLWHIAVHTDYSVEGEFLDELYEGRVSYQYCTSRIYVLEEEEYYGYLQKSKRVKFSPIDWYFIVALMLVAEVSD